MLSAKLARRARPPLGVCQPQGLYSPFTSVVERITSLVGSITDPLEAVAPASVSQASTATRELAARRVANDFIDKDLRVLRSSIGAPRLGESSESVRPVLAEGQASEPVWAAS